MSTQQWRVVCELDVWADTEAAAFDAARADLRRLADGPLVLTLTPMAPNGSANGGTRVLDSTGEAARKPKCCERDTNGDGDCDRHPRGGGAMPAFTDDAAGNVAWEQYLKATKTS